LLINGAECEPYISCDDMLMQTQAIRIWQGIHLLCRILQPRQCVLAIEDNKPAAILAMRQGLQLLKQGFACTTHLRVVPTRYPTGGEKQLIKIITGREVPSGKLPLHIGVVCQNVATAKAIADAVLDHSPLISRLITVTGDGIHSPGNYQVLLGTPISHLIRECGGLSSKQVSLTMGGPMMGVSLHSAEVPVVKGMNCLLVRKQRPAKPELACIRCGQCARACPMSLLPQQLYRYARAREFDKARDLALMDCIECGCCDYVCPSGIPLVQHYRFAKAELRTQQQEKHKSDLARQRHAHRQQRIEAERTQRQQKQRRQNRATNGSDNQSVSV
jgi:Na+-translocating ferredoxin:NAD+ oxidoreductase subunit C